MNINIVLSPSQQSWNACKCGDTEQDHTFIIAEKIANLLKGYNCNVCLIPKITGTEAETLNKVVEISNIFIAKNGGTGYHLDIHTDAGGGSGACGFHMSEAGKAMVLSIIRELGKITTWTNGTASYRDLFVLRHTKAVSGLIELAAHDIMFQAKWIHDKADDIAKAIVKGLEQSIGIVKNVPEEHWAEKPYQKLLNAGYAIHDRRFDDNLTRGELFAILSQKL